MKILGISRLLVLAIILANTAVCLATEPVDANWYSYTDDFQTIENVENDSYYHSILWPQNAFPPSEPFIYYLDSETLGFGGYNGQAATLIYRLPFEQEEYIKTVSGELKIDVLKPEENWSTEQELEYFLSPDGINWSNGKELESGTNTIDLKSIRGICYIKFSGIGVLIDNLNVFLNQDEAIRFVPSQYQTIQSAIDDANEGDIIEVAPGTYSGNGNTNIDLKGKSITIRSKEGPERTIIDCQNKSRGFYFHSAEDSNSILCGFTIKNAMIAGSAIPGENQNWYQSSSHPVGGGIYCEYSNPGIIDCIIQNCSTKLGGGIGIVGSSPYIADCIIKNCNAGNLVTNQSGGNGAGIALIRDSVAVIVNTIIKDNKTFYESKGAGLYCYQSLALLSNCEIRNNSKDRGTPGNLLGGGVYSGSLLTDIELRNCVIADNTAQSGAGIYTDSIENISGMKSNIICNVRVINCTIANNNITEPQDTIGGGIHSLKSNIIVKNSIIWANQSKDIYIEDSYNDNPISFSDFPGGDEEGDDNIDIDPCFVLPSASSITDRDYHLKSKTGHYAQGNWITDNPDQMSSCIDAGDPMDNIGFEPFPHGNRINMGAYGGTEQASKNEFTQYIFHVSTSGSNNNSGLSKDNAFRTIQYAINMAIDGDIIMIWPGTYYEEDISFQGKAITIQSADEAAVIVANNGYAFSFNTAESWDSVLRNLIIKNCVGYGAIYCDYASPTLTNLTIVNNSFGISTYNGASPDVKNCIFWNNTDDYDIHDPFILRYISFCRLSTKENLLDQKTNITYDPRFIDNDSDFHLRYNSKCIDAGYGDFSREPQPNGGKINMGAYGGTPFASTSN